MHERCGLLSISILLQLLQHITTYNEQCCTHACVCKVMEMHDVRKQMWMCERVVESG